MKEKVEVWLISHIGITLTSVLMVLWKFIVICYELVLLFGVPGFLSAFVVHLINLLTWREDASSTDRAVFSFVVSIPIYLALFYLNLKFYDYQEQEEKRLRERYERKRKEE